MKQELEQATAAAVKELFDVDVSVELTRPAEQFGDYATNVALQLAKVVGKNPHEIAESLRQRLVSDGQFHSVTVAGPGFLNLKLSDETLVQSLQAVPVQAYAGQSVVAEYSDPNPFKMLHAGHIYTTVVGDAIANLVENAGATVHRVNYGGDVGRHVAITMWCILHRLGGEYPEKLEDIPDAERAAWLASAYVEGNNTFETDEAVKPEIIKLNKQVYQIVNENDHDSPLAQIYWTCRAWSYEAFDAFYARLGTKLEKYYPESEVAAAGLAIVHEQTGKVFQESDGAIVFRGEDYGLHTRVFVNREGLPTYEAKEIGLFYKKREDYQFDRSIIVTANEQEQYMAVVIKALEQFEPEIAARATHVNHGMVRLAGGVKMSSRKGNIIPATEVLDVTAEAIEASGRKPDNSVVLGAIKYAFLKTRVGGDIVYDPAESVSLEGNSGPYLQYAHARARSILAKASDSRHPELDSGSSQEIIAEGDKKSDWIPAFAGMTTLEPGERSLLRKITEYPEVVQKATSELMPHHICTYLYELAQAFNSFYEHNRVIGDEREAVRLQLVTHYADTLKNGLNLLGITAPDRM